MNAYTFTQGSRFFINKFPLYLLVHTFVWYSNLQKTEEKYREATLRIYKIQQELKQEMASPVDLYANQNKISNGFNETTVVRLGKSGTSGVDFEKFGFEKSVLDEVVLSRNAKALELFI